MRVLSYAGLQMRARHIIHVTWDEQDHSPDLSIQSFYSNNDALIGQWNNHKLIELYLTFR
jgi:hypothetical protein